jgi:hypothetical protein
MHVRNAVWRPPFVMYYRTTPFPAVRDDLTAAGFTVERSPWPPRPAPGRYSTVLARGRA